MGYAGLRSNFYTRLAHDCGFDIGFPRCGACYIYRTIQGWEHVQAGAARARSYGTQLEVLSAGWAASVVSPVNFKATKGIPLDPDSIRVRAGDAIRCVGEHLAHEGVTFRYNTRVLELVRAGGQVVGVKTSAGEFRAPTTVIALGVWSRRLVESRRCKVSDAGQGRYTLHHSAARCAAFHSRAPVQRCGDLLYSVGGRRPADRRRR